MWTIEKVAELMELRKQFEEESQTAKLKDSSEDDTETKFSDVLKEAQEKLNEDRNNQRRGRGSFA